MEAVAGLLVGELAVFFPHQLRIGAAADGVVPARCVANDGGEETAHVRMQAMTLG